MRATRGYQKRRDLIEDPNEEIWRNQGLSGLGSVLRLPIISSTLKKVGILITFVLFLPLG